ncbi:TQO small subunit DoxD [Nostocoides sp.]|uniref:TQO small subunit DoxD n=1 Tax=Nostocoides sp. TaxID=1917966 RepID=UPI002C2CFC85|nr:TQO small subunit DoxD [Tetrasphaera sp.]
MLSAESRTAIPLDRGLLALLRVSLALMWIQNVFWKVPPDFGLARKADLYQYVNHAVEHPVLAPYAWIVEHVVLPNFVAFGWLTLLSEAALGAFLLVGLATRLWALVGVGQSVAIALSVLLTPGEWHWSYYLMVVGHLAVYATAAGRYYGVDAVLRPIWSLRSDPVARLARVAS